MLSDDMSSRHDVIRRAQLEEDAAADVEAAEARRDADARQAHDARVKKKEASARARARASERAGHDTFYLSLPPRAQG